MYAREIYDEHLAETIESFPEIVAMNTIRCDTVAGLNTVVHLWLLEKGVKATDYLLECLCRWRMAVEVSFLRTDNRYNVPRGRRRRDGGYRSLLPPHIIRIDCWKTSLVIGA